jgi:hypothetical protein
LHFRPEFVAGTRNYGYRSHAASALRPYRSARPWQICNARCYHIVYIS